ncbi:MAG: response regulator [Caulobacteraceae bacterium]
MSEQLTDAGSVLIVDDDPGICAAVSEFLADHGYAVATAPDGEAMRRRLAEDKVDVIVLDVMLPGEDGLAICRKLMGSNGPAVVMLSALGEDADRILGLELGADDYLSKPCNPRELLARIRAVMRRRDGARGRPSATCEFAGWRLNLVRRELKTPDGVVMNLTQGEFSLLHAFVERPRRILTRDELLDAARGPDSDAFDRAIDVQISRLRRKLGESVGGHELIRTVRSGGYNVDALVTWR